jgi:hypothetical protein
MIFFGKVMSAGKHSTAGLGIDIQHLGTRNASFSSPRAVIDQIFQRAYTGSPAAGPSAAINSRRPIAAGVCLFPPPAKQVSRPIGK